jgi:serine/threonine-protein kinase RsbW
MSHKHLTITADPARLKDVRHAVMELAFPCLPAKAHLVALAVDEAVANAILHGTLPQGGGGIHATIDVDIHSDGQRLEVRIGDGGPAYDPRQADMPDLHARVRSRQRGGLGLQIIRRVMDEVHYARLDNQRNELRLVKYID